jgi:GDPmannose 4,6-dehydratase
MTNTKRALITGVTGQDGAYLSKLLLEKGYEVYGTARRGASEKFSRLEFLNVLDNINIIDFDLLEFSNIQKTIQSIMPHEIYNLAAQSFVPTSFDLPILTSDINALGTLRILDSILTIDKNIKFYQASTSEMFGKVKKIPQDEETLFHPRSPYGVSKTFAHYSTINYRESYDMFACSGILFNHESPLRGHEFVTKKIARTLSKIKHGSNEILEIGNVEARRDWGFAGDYVKAMYLILNHKVADDYVVSTGTNYSVKDFICKCLELLDIKYEWLGEGTKASVKDVKTNKTIIKVNEKYFRPAEVDTLIGNPNKIKSTLGWEPEYTFDMLVEEMIKFELDNSNIIF